MASDKLFAGGIKVYGFWPWAVWFEIHTRSHCCCLCLYCLPIYTMCIYCCSELYQELCTQEEFFYVLLFKKITVSVLKGEQIKNRERLKRQVEGEQWNKILEQTEGDEEIPPFLWKVVLRLSSKGLLKTINLKATQISNSFTVYICSPFLYINAYWLLHLFMVCVMCVDVCVCATEHREELVGVVSLLPCGSWGSEKRSSGLAVRAFICWDNSPALHLFS